MNEPRPQPVWKTIGTKEILTAVVILVFLFARDLGISVPEDTKLQIILVVTLIGGALAAHRAASMVTPTENPQLDSGTRVKVTDPQTGAITGSQTLQ